MRCLRAVSVALLMGLWCGSFAEAAIGIGTSCTGQATSVTSLSIPSCSNSGSNRLAVASVRYNNNDVSIISVTYAASVMTLILASAETAPGSELRQYRLTNPTSGSQTFQVQFTGAVDVEAIVTPFDAVDQVTPVGTAVQDHGTTNSASSVVSSATGELVYDTVWVFDSLGLTIGGGQTQQAAITGVSSTRSSTEAGAGSVTMSWSWTNAGDGYLHVATPIKPAAAEAAADFFFRRRF
jgi:hypothetical protein